MRNEILRRRVKVLRTFEAQAGEGAMRPLAL
jgi:hypothetical protein